MASDEWIVLIWFSLRNEGDGVLSPRLTASIPIRSDISETICKISEVIEKGGVYIMMVWI